MHSRAGSFEIFSPGPRTHFEWAFPSPARGLVALCLLLVSCSTDPVHDAAVARLGPEVTGVPPSEYHRAGQPCGVCHSGEGPAHTVFVLAGTLFATPYPARIGVGGALVDIEDSAGNGCTAQTNCVGNFFILPGATVNPCKPEFPVWVGIAAPGSPKNTVTMTGHIGRDPSCAGCHSDPPTSTSPGHVVVGAMGPAGMCPVSPALSGPDGGTDAE